jgi:hypothetical protein
MKTALTIGFTLGACAVGLIVPVAVNNPSLYGHPERIGATLLQSLALMLALGIGMALATTRRWK